MRMQPAISVEMAKSKKVNIRFIILMPNAVYTTDCRLIKFVNRLVG